MTAAPARRKFGLVLVATGAVIVLGSVFLSNDLNRTALAGGTGDVAAGGALGLSVGMPATEAEARLTAHGLKVVPDETPEAPCLGRTYKPDETVRIFADDSWRRGTICLASQNDRLSRIVWYFAPLSP